MGRGLSSGVPALPGRVTATVFTLGIFARFKRPVSLDDPQEFNLEPDEISEKEYKRRQAEVLKEFGSQRGE